MVGKRKAGKTRANKKAAAAPAEKNVASIYEEMLGEAAAPDDHISERPLKKPRPNSLAARGRLRLFEPASPRTEDKQPLGEKEEEQPPAPVTQTVSDDEGGSDSDDPDDDIEFEDVVIAPDFSNIDHSTGPVETPPAMVELDLSKHQAASAARAAARRSRPMTKEDRLRRLNIHKTHLLCLLVHCALRNHWCNDERVQNTLQPLLTDKMIKHLIPPASLSQFGRTESLKKGLEQVSSMFRSKYQITERGVRRALWAESPEQLASLKEEPPDDLDSCATKHDFRRAARRLEGSRDVGAQLYCALLRSAGLEARLVCSLQVLGAAPGMPTRAAPAPAAAVAAGKSRRSQRSEPAAAVRDSPFPVYWVEVLDVAHQRWQPTDPIVTGSYWKPRALEPAGSDRENCLAYVVAFAEDGSARDVTRRYAKAYAAKTRRMRVEALEGDRAGERWWRRALSRFRRRPELLPWTTAGEATDLDLDQIEDGELAALEAREPMPRGVADFKDHPVYALERHLRRAEVLVPGARQVGTVGVGSRGALEPIYRRSDVRVARSSDKWYRMGRVVKPGEQPAKFITAAHKRGRGRDDDHDDDDDESRGGGGGRRTAVFRPEQTDPYRAPAVVNGVVPKNRFRNIDVYVPAMVPAGGEHIRGASAGRAAFLIGVDYAPALTGFEFRASFGGRRHGTAVLDGVVVASEYAAAVRAVMDGLVDLEVDAEAERRAARAVRSWRRFLIALRIHERVWAGFEGERGGGRDDTVKTADTGDRGGGGGGFINDSDGGTNDGGGGGFLNDDGDGDDDDGGSDTGEAYGGGGFLDDDDGGGGGFMVE